MNILFLSLGVFDDIAVHDIYADLLREFVNNGNNVYAVSPLERRTKKKTYLVRGDNYQILKLRMGNIQKTNFIEKGITTLAIEKLFIYGINKYFKGCKFDLILYSTPPVTFYSVISYVKKRDGAFAYLMLKDIFPQNAIDLGLFKKNGLIHKYFRAKEKKLYLVSDVIGCTSPENIRFILKNNEIDEAKVEICVNCMEPYGELPDSDEIVRIRNQYGLPLNKKIFLYGGNLGKPQGVDFLMKCLAETSDINDAYFLIVGSGTEKEKLGRFIENNHIKNARLMNYIPKTEFDRLTSCCDVGMIFLNIRNTTPNTPSRLLSYTNAAIPVLAVTDRSTDIGEIIREGRFGWSCYSDDVNVYKKKIEEIVSINDFSTMKKYSHDYLLNNYTADKTYKGIAKHLDGRTSDGSI